MERRTVLDLIDHPAKPRLFPVGRLGWDETGLVLLTNDGELANRLTHPRFGVAKTYLAIVKGDVNETDLRRMTKEMFKLQRLASRQAGRLRSARVELSIFKKDPGKTTLRVTMKEGKNRYVADVLGQAGFPVRKVAAVSIGPLQLRGLPLGAWRELERDEVKMLRQACKEGAAAAKKSGLSAASRARPAALRPSAIPGQRPERSTRSGRGPERGKSSTPSPRYASGGSSKRKIRSARQDQP